ncbi:hypothetical protein [Rhodococcus baikonurensis]|uniref:hypothetical protein n=1 Tax=Rhodococcus baikonurensis TaxID=172041 RepID=UPI0037C8B5DB
MLRSRIPGYAVVALALTTAMAVGFHSFDPHTHQRGHAPAVANARAADALAAAAAGDFCDLVRDANGVSSRVRILVGTVDCPDALRISARYIEKTSVHPTGHGRLASIDDWVCSSLYVDSRGINPFLQCTDFARNSFSIEAFESQ